MAEKYPKAWLSKNDKLAFWLIGVFSAVVFILVSLLHFLKNPSTDIGFDKHKLPLLNACLNSTVSFLLIGSLMAVRQKRYALHRQLMLVSLILSVIFLGSYVLYHLVANETHFGGSESLKYLYYFILTTHIFLAGTVLPFILFTAYRGLTAEFALHKKTAMYTWAVWLYVSVTGVLVYLMISPYYT